MALCVRDPVEQSPLLQSHVNGSLARRQLRTTLSSCPRKFLSRTHLVPRSVCTLRFPISVAPTAQICCRPKLSGSGTISTVFSTSSGPRSLSKGTYRPLAVLFDRHINTSDALLIGCVQPSYLALVTPASITTTLRALRKSLVRPVLLSLTLPLAFHSRGLSLFRNHFVPFSHLTRSTIVLHALVPSPGRQESDRKFDAQPRIRWCLFTVNLHAGTIISYIFERAQCRCSLILLLHTPSIL